MRIMKDERQVRDEKYDVEESMSWSVSTNLIVTNPQIPPRDIIVPSRMRLQMLQSCRRLGEELVDVTSSQSRRFRTQSVS